MSDLNDFIEPNTTYEIKIGKSFQTNSKLSYHQFKYDFTPASIDKNQESNVKIGEIGDVVVQMPHIEGSAQKYTQFTGNKQPTSKECVLIYDPKTKEFVLERLQSNFILKRSRLEGSSKAQIITPRAITPTNEKQKKKKDGTAAAGENNANGSSGVPPTNIIPTNPSSDSKRPQQTSSKQQQQQQASARREVTTPPLAPPPLPPPQPTRQTKTEQLFGNDLNLSDDGTDSNDEM